MAFDTGDNTKTNGSDNNRDANWKATGFINIYLPANDGSRVKLGAIPLKTSKPREHELATWLAGADIPADVQNRDDVLAQRMAKLIAKLELEYASAEPSEAKGFDLS